jgi:hypothetical protein
MIYKHDPGPPITGEARITNVQTTREGKVVIHLSEAEPSGLENAGSHRIVFTKDEAERIGAAVKIVNV